MLYPDQWGDSVSLLERLLHFLSATESPPTYLNPAPFLSVSSR